MTPQPSRPIPRTHCCIACESAAAGGRGDSRRHARGFGPARSEDRRTERAGPSDDLWKGAANRRAAVRSMARAAQHVHRGAAQFSAAHDAGVRHARFRSIMGRRNVSNVPAQALILMNDPFVVQQARLWAERLLSGESSAAERVRGMFSRRTARPPPTRGARRRAWPFSQEQARTVERPERSGTTGAPGPTSRTCCLTRRNLSSSVKEFDCTSRLAMDSLRKLHMFPCGADPPLSRREMLARCAHGFGAVALTALLAARIRRDGRAGDTPRNSSSLAPRPPHFRGEGAAASSFSTWMAARRRSIPSIPSRG